MTTQAITIRVATTADVQSIVELNHGLFQEDAGQRDPTVNLNGDRAELIEHFTKLVAGDTSVCFLAVVDSTPIGYLAGYIYGPSSFRPIKAARMESIFVSSAWRSQNVGGRLTQAFAAWAHSHAAERISVTAYATNARAIAFYQRQGFTPYTLTLEYPLPPTEA